jgi:phosphoserine phosphatase
VTQTPVLITTTGPDKPGVSSVLFAVLTRHDVDVLDVEQVVIRGQLVLGVLAGVYRDPEGLQEAVEQAMASVGMQVDVKIGSAIGDDPFALGRRDSTHVLVVLGRPVTARGFSEVARRLAARGLFLSHGDFYAATVVERLSLLPEGLVRAGCACYTTREEVERLVAAVAEVAREG